MGYSPKPLLKCPLTCRKSKFGIFMLSAWVGNSDSVPNLFPQIGEGCNLLF